MTPLSRTLKASPRSVARMLAVGVVSSALVVVGSSVALAAVTPVLLGTAGTFVVLAGAGVTATGPNTLNGDLGTYPTTSIAGPGSIIVNGTNHAGDGVTQGAKDDLVAAYNTAAGEGPTSPIVGDLAGQTLTSGVYNSGSQILLTGALTLDAAGDPDAIFVFQAGSDLIVDPGASVILTGDAQACNVFWQVGSSASLNTAVSFKGVIMALTSITLATGATVEGRVLARDGNVTLDTNTITAPVCTTVTGGGTDSGTPVTGAGVTATPGGGVSTGDGSTAVHAGSDPALPVVGVIAALTLVAVWMRTRRHFHSVS